MQLSMRQLIDMLSKSIHCEKKEAMEALLVRQRILDFRKTQSKLRDVQARLEAEEMKIGCEIIGINKDIIALQRACRHPISARHNRVCMICEVEVK